MDYTFGYGSIVNANTWERPVDYCAVKLKGWKRSWRHVVQTPAGSISALTIEPCEDRDIDGLLVETELSDREILNVREIGYDIVPLDLSGFEIADGEREIKNEMKIHAYRSFDACNQWASEDAPLLQSYLDCVLQGYYRFFCEAGVRDFIATTDCWGAPIKRDREDPVYPRAVSLSPAERDLFDALIRNL